MSNKFGFSQSSFHTNYYDFKDQTQSLKRLMVQPNYCLVPQMFTQVVSFSNPRHVKVLLDTKKKCLKGQL